MKPVASLLVGRTESIDNLLVIDGAELLGIVFQSIDPAQLRKTRVHEPTFLRVVSTCRLLQISRLALPKPRIE